jgi:hypothetical protein
MRHAGAENASFGVFLYLGRNFVDVRLFSTMAEGSNFLKFWETSLDRQFLIDIA